MQDAIYTLSARKKPQEQSMKSFLKSEYPKYKNIKSVFGFAEYSPLYAGRFFFREEITEKDAKYLDEANIGIELPMANKFFTDEDYEDSKLLLEKYHKENNIITCIDYRLAQMIRKDFPKYKIKSSVTAFKFGTNAILKALDYYDYVVLPTSMNDKFEQLEELPMKDKIVLFGSTGCSFNCSKKSCYDYMAKFNARQELPKGHHCSKENGIYREDLGFIEFDLKPLYEIGYRHFKMLRENKTHTMCHVN